MKAAAESNELFPLACQQLDLILRAGLASHLCDRLGKFNLLEVTLGGNFMTTSVTAIFYSICLLVPGDALNYRVKSLLS